MMEAKQTGFVKGTSLHIAAELVLRYGLVLVIAWIGCMKFTEYEAKGIQPLVAHSPLMSWLYQFLSVTGVAKLLGVVELAIAALIASRPLSARACEVGSGMAMAMFLLTLTFLLSTPGWEPTLADSRRCPLWLGNSC